MVRILVIDDQNHVRAAIAAALQAKGFDVVAAENGAAGLKAFDKSAFDLAIVDVFMPGMDGVQLIKAMRERNPSLPVIAISGVHLSVSGRTALDFLPMAPDLSAVVCLQKPFRPAELMQAIGKALGQAMPAIAGA
jgi:CheY-like chemotaxis protein